MALHVNLDCSNSLGTLHNTNVNFYFYFYFFYNQEKQRSQEKKKREGRMPKERVKNAKDNN